MNDDQPVIKVVDRRPFNPDGTPRELSPEEKEGAEGSNSSQVSAVEPPKSAQPPHAATPSSASPPETSARRESSARPAASAEPEGEAPRSGRDPLDDPTSFLSLIMSLASNAAASLGMMPHPVTGETGVDLKTAKHWIDVLGMLETKTRGNRDPQEPHALDRFLPHLRIHNVSFPTTPPPPPPN